MYHFIIRTQVRRAFAAVNAGAYSKLIPQFAREHEHWVAGQHALGGRRRTVSGTRRWYDRLAEIFPGLQFQLRNITVSGWPWNTTAMVEWTDCFPLGSNGEQGSNEGVHVLQFRWGRVVRLSVYCDTQKLAGYCAVLSERGVAAAAAQPISA
jgi:ketosteroid isomerase-like protein